jgi:hypothetical protein
MFANYYSYPQTSPLQGLGAYYNPHVISVVPSLRPMAGLGANGSQPPPSTWEPFTTAFSRVLKGMGITFLVYMALRAASSYYVGKRLGHPIAGSLAGTVFGTTGLFGVALFAKPGAGQSALANIKRTGAKCPNLSMRLTPPAQAPSRAQVHRAIGVLAPACDQRTIKIRIHTERHGKRVVGHDVFVERGTKQRKKTRKGKRGAR